MVLMRCESIRKAQCRDFLTQVAHIAAEKKLDIEGGSSVMILGPASAPMEKQASRARMQLLFQSTVRQALHAILSHTINHIDTIANRGSVRWSVDVDPQHLF